jgi:acyl-ACP thioesterase
MRLGELAVVVGTGAGLPAFFMTDKLTLSTTVTYGEVDRAEVMLLPRIFKLLQEVAILHANKFGGGTGAIFSRGETWILNRIAVVIERYPRYAETLRLETWSTGIKGFRGYRDFRLYDAAGHCLLKGSSIWVYLSVATKSIVRVPRELVATFPVGPEGAAFPDLEKMDFVAPAADARRIPVSLRYADFDVNEHVNNTAYLDFAQTALAAAGQNPHPRQVWLKYAKAIPAQTDRVDVAVEPTADGAQFRVERDGVVFAEGAVA